MVLKEKQVPYELIQIDLSKGRHFTKPIRTSRRSTPFGQVPVLSDGLTQIFESRAISWYIAQKYAARGAPLLPSPIDLQKWARFEQAASIEQTDFDVYASGIAGELVFGP
ncbi:hypothetical protein BU17DRAFT_45637 [Hysterangium stoloniferum]|nr:hypothetical protein BU17DRAFT_45637 [Hysterangium stoloniferum]